MIRDCSIVIFGIVRHNVVRAIYVPNPLVMSDVVKNVESD